MKINWGIGLFIAFGLISALGVGFWSLIAAGSTVYDDEQQNLNQETVIKFSFVVAENTPKGLAAQRFADLVNTYTNGHVKVQLFPDAILYDEQTELEALQNGNIQMIAPSFANISTIAPKWAVMDLPFAFANEEAVQEAFDGDIGKRLMNELKEVNIEGMAFWKNGFKQITSSKGPILHPSNFQELRFRILPSPVIDNQFREFRAKTVSLPFNRVYRSLEDGQVDGEENTLSNIYSKKFYQVQNFITLSNHGYLGYGVLMNKKFWDGLPAAQQKEIKQAMAEATVWINNNAYSFNLKDLLELKKVPGLQISELTSDEREEWESGWAPLYKNSESIVGKGLLDDVLALRQKFARINTDLE